MNGVYGTVKPADIIPSRDVDIFYSYKPSRNNLGREYEEFKKIDTDILNPSMFKVDGNKEVLSGMYNLKLPASLFGEKGIYTLYIKPKEIKTNIIDVSILLAFPEVRGLVFNLDSIRDASGGFINDLTGYRVEFVDEKGNKTDETRLITSCGNCTARKTSVNDKYAEDVRYVFSDTSSNLVFCTVTPSVSNSFKPNAKPYIGEGGKEVILVNTKFDPVMVEIEMVDHDIETISTMLEGTQVRDLDRGKIITFNDENDIYSLHEYFTLKDKLGEPLYDVKVKKNGFGEDSEDYKSIIEN